MSFLKAIRKNRTRDALKTICGILLLTLFVAGNTSFGIFHQFFHGQETAVTHSPEQEKDPCHLAIYHFETESLCEHPSHLSGSEKCDQCHFLSCTDQITVRNVSGECVKIQDMINERFIAVHLKSISLQLSSRAPPNV